VINEHSTKHLGAKYSKGTALLLMVLLSQSQ